MQKLILDTTKDWKYQFRIIKGSRYTFPSEVRISWEALKELVKQQFEAGQKSREKEIVEAVEKEKKSWYSPFDGLEIKLMYKDGDKLLQNKYIFSLEQIKFIRGLSELPSKKKFSYMLKDLLAKSESLSLTKESK